MSTINCRRLHHPGGFTLVELMITLTLAAILLGLAVPSFTGMTASNRLSTQTNELVGAITYARSEAITRNANVTLCRAANDAATTCAGSSGDWAFWILRNAAGAGEVIRRGTINTYGGSMQVTSEFTADSLTYSSDGLGRSGGGVANLGIVVCTDSGINDNMRRVEIGAGSRLSTSKDTGSCP